MAKKRFSLSLIRGVVLYTGVSVEKEKERVQVTYEPSLFPFSQNKRGISQLNIHRAKNKKKLYTSLTRL